VAPVNDPVDDVIPLEEDAVLLEEDVVLVEETEEPGGISDGVIIGIIIGITLVLMCLVCLCFFAIHRWEKRENAEEEVKEPMHAQASVPPPDAAPSPAATRRKRKRRINNRETTISFALDKPDPPGSISNIYPDDGVIASTNGDKSKATNAGAKSILIKESGDGAGDENCAAPSKNDADDVRDVPVAKASSDSAYSTKEGTDEANRAAPEVVTSRPRVDTKEPAANDQVDAMETNIN